MKASKGKKREPEPESDKPRTNKAARTRRKTRRELQGVKRRMK